ncbi:MAG TPA: phosphate ABC transporter permease subunit PstC [Atribacteraceae bacterium]|nr:phosphate ABC transporter permease subunit PstC [Atribacteraceae bacterium]
MIIKIRKWEQAEIILFFVACSSLLFLIGIILVLFMEGLPAFREVSLSEFLFGQRWLPTFTPPRFGALPLFTGTLMITLGSLAFAVPLGIFSAIFLGEICSPRLREILKPVIEMLAGIPSVVYGLFGIVILGPMIREVFSLPTGLTAFTASVILGVMAMPAIVSVAEDAITSVPRDYREASIALGATHWETIRHVLLPAAFSGISASIILGAGRIIGETMTVLMVAGGSPVIPTSLFQPVRAMTATIAAEMAEAPFGGLHYQVLFLIAVILFLVTLFLNMLVERIVYKYHSRVR